MAVHAQIVPAVDELIDGGVSSSSSSRSTSSTTSSRTSTGTTSSSNRSVSTSSRSSGESTSADTSSSTTRTVTSSTSSVVTQTSTSSVTVDDVSVDIDNSKGDLYNIYLLKKIEVYHSTNNGESYSWIPLSRNEISISAFNGSSNLESIRKIFGFDTTTAAYNFIVDNSDLVKDTPAITKKLITNVSLNAFLNTLGTCGYTNDNGVRIINELIKDGENLAIIHFSLGGKNINLTNYKTDFTNLRYKFTIKLERSYLFDGITAKTDKYNTLLNYKNNIIFNKINDESSVIKYADIKDFLWFTVDTFKEINTITVKLSGIDVPYVLVGPDGKLHNTSNSTPDWICNDCGYILNQSEYNENNKQCPQCGSFNLKISEDNAIVDYHSTNSIFIQPTISDTTAKYKTQIGSTDGSFEALSLRYAEPINEGAVDFYYNQENYLKHNLYSIKCYIPGLIKQINYSGDIDVFVEFKTDPAPKNAFRAFSNSHCELQYLTDAYNLYTKYEPTDKDSSLIAVFKLNEGESKFTGGINVFYGNQLVYNEKYGADSDDSLSTILKKGNGEKYSNQQSIYYSTSILNDYLYVYVNLTNPAGDPFILNKYVSIYILDYDSNIIGEEDIAGLSQDIITLHSVDVSIPQFTKGDNIVLIDDYIHGKTKHYTNYTILSNANGTYTYYGLRAYAKRDGLSPKHFDNTLYDLGIDGLTYNVNATIVPLKLKKEQQNIYSFKSGSELVVFKKASTGTIISNSGGSGDAMTFNELLNDTYTLSYEFIVDGLIPKNSNSDDYNLRFYTVYAYAGEVGLGDFSKIEKNRNNPNEISDKLKYSIEYTYTYQCNPYFERISFEPNGYINNTILGIREDLPELYAYNDNDVLESFDITTADLNDLPPMFISTGDEQNPYSQYKEENIYKKSIYEYKYEPYVVSNNNVLKAKPDNIYKKTIEYVKIAPSSITLDIFKSTYNSDTRYYKYIAISSSYAPYSNEEIQNAKSVPLNIYVKYIYYLKTADSTVIDSNSYYINYSYVAFNPAELYGSTNNIYEYNYLDNSEDPDFVMYVPYKEKTDIAKLAYEQNSHAEGFFTSDDAITFTPFDITTANLNSLSSISLYVKENGAYREYDILNEYFNKYTQLYIQNTTSGEYKEFNLSKELLNSGKKIYQKLTLDNNTTYIPYTGFKTDGSIEYYGFKLHPLTEIPGNPIDWSVIDTGHLLTDLLNKPVAIKGKPDRYNIYIKQDYSLIRSTNTRYPNYLTNNEISELKTQGVEIFKLDSGINYLSVDEDATIYDIDTSGNTIYSSDESLDTIISINYIRERINGIQYTEDISKDNIVKRADKTYTLNNFLNIKYRVVLTGKYTKVNYESIEYSIKDNVQYSKYVLFKKQTSIAKLSNALLDEIYTGNTIKNLLEYNTSSYLFVPLFSKLNVADLDNFTLLQEIFISGKPFYHFVVINDRVYPVNTVETDKSGLIYYNDGTNPQVSIIPLYVLDESNLYVETSDLHACVNKQYFKEKHENIIHGKLQDLRDENMPSYCYVRRDGLNIDIDSAGKDSIVRYYGPAGGYNDADIFTGKLDKDDLAWVTENCSEIEFNDDTTKLTGTYNDVKQYFHKVKLGPHVIYIKNDKFKEYFGSENYTAYHRNITNLTSYVNVEPITSYIDFNFKTLSLREYKPIYYRTSNDEYYNLQDIQSTLGSDPVIRSQKSYKNYIERGENTYIDEILLKSKFFYSSYTFNDGIHIDADGSYYTNIAIFDGNNGKITKKMPLNNHVIDITKYSYDVTVNNRIPLNNDETLNNIAPYDYNKYYIEWNDPITNELISERLNEHSLSPAYYGNDMNVNGTYTLYTYKSSIYTYDYNNIGSYQLAYKGEPIVLQLNDGFYGIVFNEPIYDTDKQNVTFNADTLAFGSNSGNDDDLNNLVNSESDIVNFTSSVNNNETNNWKDKVSFPLAVENENEYKAKWAEYENVFNTANNELYYNHNDYTNKDITYLYVLNTYWTASDYLYEIVELSKFPFKDYDSDGTIIQYKDVSTYSIETSKPFTLANSEIIKFTGTYSWVPPEFDTKVLADGTTYTVISRDGYYKKDYVIEDKPLTVASYNYYSKDEVSSINVSYSFIPYSYVVASEINHAKISYDYLINECFEEIRYSYLLNGFEYDYTGTYVSFEDGSYFGNINIPDIDGTYAQVKVNLYKKNTVVSKTSVKEITVQEPYTSYEYFAYKESTPLTNEKIPVLYKTELIPASKRKVQYWNSTKGSYSIKSVLDSYAYYAYYYTYETVPFKVASYVYLDELNIVGFDGLTNTLGQIGYDISTQVDKQSAAFEKMTVDLSYIFNTLVKQDKELADEEAYILSTYATSIDNSLKDFAYENNNTLSGFATSLGEKIVNFTDTEKAAINSLETNIVEQFTESNNITKTGLSELSDIVKGQIESLEVTLHSDLIGEGSSQEVETKYTTVTYTPINSPMSGLITGYTVSTNEGSDTIKIGGDSLGEIIQSTLGTTSTRTVRTDNEDGSYTIATYTGFTGLANILGNLTISNRIPDYNEFMVDLVPKMYAAIDFEGDYDVKMDVNGNVISKTKRSPADMAKKCIMRAEVLWTELKKKGIVS